METRPLIKPGLCQASEEGNFALLFLFVISYQDYGWSNGQEGPGGIWIIDLDGVSFDLPIRDLRKLITSTMDDMGTWDVTWMRGMIDAYSQAYPIEPALFQVLLIDMSLPNEFYKHVKAGVSNTAACEWDWGLTSTPFMHGRILPIRYESGDGMQVTPVKDAVQVWTLRQGMEQAKAQTAQILQSGAKAAAMPVPEKGTLLDVKV